MFLCKKKKKKKAILCVFFEEFSEPDEIGITCLILQNTLNVTVTALCRPE